jgi:DNA-binding GntR family transcriptional regulator
MITGELEGRPSLVDNVVDHVFHKIVCGEYPPGSRVTEEQLAEEVNVSRTPVREAVKRLAELGLIIIKPRCGLVVTSVDERDVREVRCVREELEALAVRLAAARAKPDDIKRLRAIQEECERLAGQGDDRLALFRQDSRLHLALASLSGNRHLEELLHRLDVKVTLCRMFLCTAMEQVARNVRYHRHVIDALEEGDVERAEEAMRHHVQAVDPAAEVRV